RSIVEQHELDPYAIVLIRQTSLPITSSGKVQRNLCREQYLADELKIVHSWLNPAMRATPKPAADRVSVQIHGEGVAAVVPGAGTPRLAAANGAATNSNGSAAKQASRGP